MLKAFTEPPGVVGGVRCRASSSDTNARNSPASLPVAEVNDIVSEVPNDCGKVGDPSWGGGHEP